MERQAQHRSVIRRLFLIQLAIVAAILALVVFLLFAPQTLGTLPMAFLAGGLGGSIALIRRLPRADDSTIAALAAGWIETCMPLLYGGLMGGVTYFLFMSGILTGDSGGGLFTSNLFPNFTAPGSEPGELLNMETILKLRPVETKDLGKLLIWCFIAGYSEKFVQGVLGTLEERGSGGGRDRTPDA